MNRKASRKDKDHDLILEELYFECERWHPFESFSNSLRKKLENFNVEDRKKLVTTEKDGAAPLFVACRQGNVELVKFLIETCHADVEQCGKYKVENDSTIHVVSPLWCAAVSGNLQVVKCLIENGANINSVSDTGSTAVRSACFMTHFDIVVYLVENGADTLKANYNGGTCLINSVQSVKLCKFLLDNGALVNTQDIQRKIALHYAIQENRLETVELLLDYGSDVRIRSRFGDDALRTACLKGATSIVSYLIERCNYTKQEIAECYELLGAITLDEHHDLSIALQYWRSAILLREQHNCIKVIEPVCKISPKLRELTTLSELEDNIDDLNYLRMQSLLIYERILGPLHKDTIYHIMYRGAEYAGNSDYVKCVSLWIYAIFLRIQKDTLLHSETYFSLDSMLRIVLESLRAQNCDDADRVPFVLIHDIVSMIADEMTEAMAMVVQRPTYQRQVNNFDKILYSVIHFIHILHGIVKSRQEVFRMKRLIHRVITLNPTSSTGKTLLHLVFTISNLLYSDLQAPNFEYCDISAQYKMAKLLLNCGANPNYGDESGLTPLHMCCKRLLYSEDTVLMLLENSGHIDYSTRNGITPEQMLTRVNHPNIHVIKYIKLQCLAARVIKRCNINFKGLVPLNLECFIERH